MKKNIFLLLICFILNSCGFHLRNNNEVPEHFKILNLINNDSNFMIVRELKRLFNYNDVTLFEENFKENTPTLVINSSQFSKNVVSVYVDGSSAEYQLTLNIGFTITGFNKENYPLNIKINRSFFDNPATALAKSTEQNFIQNEMYREGARLIIDKLKSISLEPKN